MCVCVCMYVCVYVCIYIYVCVCHTLPPSTNKDEIIPVSHGHMLADRCGGPVELMLIDGGGHNDLEAYPSFFDGLADYIQRRFAADNAAAAAGGSGGGGGRK